MKCPGQDSRFWGKDAIFEAACPECGSKVEFFKDEPSRKCPKCGHKFVNPKMDFGCAAYCKYAEQCLGELPPELLAQREHLLKDRVAVEAKKQYGRNFQAISRSIRAARYAEEILRSEGGDPAVVIMAAHLHAIPPEPGKQSGSPDESADAAEKLLKNLSVRKEIIEEVCNLVRYQNEVQGDLSKNEAIFRDALALAELEENLKKGKKDKLRNDMVWHTKIAEKIASDVFNRYGG